MGKMKRTFQFLLWAGLFLSHPVCAASPVSSNVLHTLYISISTVLLLFLMMLLFLYRKYRNLSRLLSQEVSTDYLTNIYNRRHFWELLESNIALAHRHRQPLALLLLDVDNFKGINDQYGHATGDTVLQKIAACLSNEIRLEDQVARLGGDEFAVLLPLTKKDTALFIAERLRSCLEHLDLTDAHSDLHITTSIGVAALISDMRADDLYEKADKALYEAKRMGRNRSLAAKNNNAPLTA